MSLKQAIQALQSELDEHENAAKKLRAAIASLRALNGAAVSTGAKPPATPKRRKKLAVKAAPKQKTAPKKKSATKGKRSARKGSLSSALGYVLKEYSTSQSAPPTGPQLYEDVQRAGFRFGSTKQANNMNYLYKTLRKNAQFKKLGTGYALA